MDKPRKATDPHQTSVLVPILFIVFALATALALAQLRFTVVRLDKTDQIACEFLNADAGTRLRQAVNAAKSSAAGDTFDKATVKLHSLFLVQRVSQTAPQRTASQPLFAYLEAQHVYVRAAVLQQRKNTLLTRALAAKARALARRLNCNAT